MFYDGVKWILVIIGIIVLFKVSTIWLFGASLKAVAHRMVVGIGLPGWVAFLIAIPFVALLAYGTSLIFSWSGQKRRV